ncbi:MlaA family lipoprotein [Piscinibacter sp.]|uniref:MlaA family lipoprotein n=1 Tax=Piscinibacter sp. TaxID=1903157 RepID=UPI002BE36C30|nr:VacJ family lipoprotein [Albitalea sp.]HUG23246.1 VacJ family lipoprotein [Albitalea sp.]
MSGSRGLARRGLRWAVLLSAAGLLQGCSTTGARTAGERLDPWEKWNRKVFTFNERLDEKVLEPVATGYSRIVPRPVRNGIDNFFGNAADAWSAVNNFLQGKVENGLNDMIRFGTNTIFGLGGVLDVATEFGIDHQYEDFGQTLGAWGIGPGAYIVWPLFGPSSVRESLALPLDRAVSPALAINDGTVRWEITGLHLINTRANLLGANQLLDEIALDKYTFVRDGYLQRRRSLVFDGDAPPTENEDDEDDFDDTEESPSAEPTPKSEREPSKPDVPAPAR